MPDSVQELNAGVAALNIDSAKAAQGGLNDLLSQLQADLNFTIPQSTSQSGWKNPIDVQSMSTFDPKSLQAISDDSSGSNTSQQGHFATSYTTLASNKRFFTLSAYFEGDPIDPDVKA